MKKLIIPFAVLFAVATVLGSCGVGKKDKTPEINSDSYIIDDTVTLETRDGETLIEDGRNYYVLTFENDRVKSTSYALRYLDPDTARAMYETYLNDMGSLYTSVRLDGTFLILTYSDENQNSLNGLSRALIEQTFGDKIIK